MAYLLYRSVRYVEGPSVRNAALLGLALGGLTLTRGWITPAALVIAMLLCTVFLRLPLLRSVRHLALAVLVAIGLTLVWLLPGELIQPYGHSPLQAWMEWNCRQFSPPSVKSLQYFLRVGIWFFWPAWPFAAWAVYAWRRQHHVLHIVVPLTFVAMLAILGLCHPDPDPSQLLPLLPPLAVMAAFGLLTMKRGAINAIDWFSVMVLTICAFVLWLFWFATLTGWPPRLAYNALKLLPGFKPELELVAFFVAACVSAGWVALVHWRISRQPAVLWRAVVLSSGGLILIWVLIMTLFLPELNYSKSYTSVAHQISIHLPPDSKCINSNVGPAQRATFGYYGRLPFAEVGQKQCDLYLLQDSTRVTDKKERLPKHAAGWVKLWEGRRPTDDVERFRLYQRVR